MNKRTICLLLALLHWAGTAYAGYISQPDATFVGGTLTEQLITDNLGIEFEESDTNPTCAAGNFNIFADLSELKLKKCQDGTASDLDNDTTPSLETIHAADKELTTANSLANAKRIGDGTTAMCHYTDAALGLMIRPCTDANVRTIIPPNFTWALYDIEGDTAIETVDPDAASTLAMWTYGTAYRPKKSIWFGAGSLSTDGTQCAAPAEVTINSGPKIWTIICTENDASTIYGSVRMRDAWDAGTLTFTHVYIQTAADTGSMFGELSAQCRGNGEAPSSTWGTVVELDDAAVTGSNQNDMITSTAVTPAGTCAAGDMLYWRWQYDATANPTTAAATLNHVGFNMEYSETSRSD